MWGTKATGYTALWWRLGYCGIDLVKWQSANSKVYILIYTIMCQRLFSFYAWWISLNGNSLSRLSFIINNPTSVFLLLKACWFDFACLDTVILSVKGSRVFLLPWKYWRTGLEAEAAIKIWFQSVFLGEIWRRNLVTIYLLIPRKSIMSTWDGW